MKRELLIEKVENLKAEMPEFVLEYYHAKMAVPYSLTTMFEYLKEYKRFFSWLIDSGVVEQSETRKISLDDLHYMKKTDMESFITYLRELPRQNSHAKNQGLSQSTINRTIVSISSLYKFLTEEVENTDGEPYFHRNVMKKISTRKKQETLAARAANIKPKLFLGDETQAYLDFIENTYPQTLDTSTRSLNAFMKNKERDLAINALILASGIRLSEAVGLNLDDINLHTLRVEVLRKGGKRDSVNIAPFALRYLETYLAIRKERYQPERTEKALFLTFFSGQANRMDASSIEKMVGKYSQAFKVKVSPHKLRHTLATRLYEETNSQVLVSHQLGHSSTQVTDLYTHIVDETQKNALDKL